MLTPGVTAPEFGLADADMALVKFSEYRGKRNVVLYFYDKDNLPGSTMEAWKKEVSVGSVGSA